ncbi:MAG: hypothetical protein A2087_13480 [Spirochaetes bacterium GWD1_61_31]|nr:MAG: hypothetical protein A2Y37_02885 [Spirochaetes bacterium GWB1_60_80]OHD31314.1 MAG: hypothetical protein A2004_13760 [Spirochaetes bacterium GWC1_61_12]OHD39501.1 MAG: hypothetical protein A2087_13480 [Spirochaetes bacterium GWD1_61_31]OHD58125.1 MAG: hypothetical protein A2Y32_05730 [Spirochaetes bacterium GWF1_60_12]
MAIFLSVLGAFGAVTVVGINFFLTRWEIEEAKEKVRQLTDVYLSIHRYFSEELKPTLFAEIEAGRLANWYEPVWMSSSFAISRIQDYVSQGIQERYRYRHAAINARNPEREADAGEAAFLRAMNEDPDLVQRSLFADYDGKPYFVVYNKGETIQADCLRCHSQPELAPPGLVEQYGDRRGFYLETGYISSVEVFMIPIGRLYENRQRIVVLIALVLLACGGIGVVAILAINQRHILTPLDTLSQTVSAITRDRRLLESGINVSLYEPEFRSLIWDFNELARELWQYEAHLEELVQSKTADLGKAVEAMRLLLREVHHRVKNHLSLIVSFADLQRMSVKSVESREVLSALIGRMTVIIVLHEMLHRSKQGDEVVQLKEYLELLLDRIAQSLIDDPALRCVWSVEDCTSPLGLKLTDLGILITELVMNAIKYATLDSGGGGATIRIVAARQADELVLRVTNPAQAPAVAAPGAGASEKKLADDDEPLGTIIIESLMQDLGGTYQAGLEAGLYSVELRIPYRPAGA